MTEQGWKWDAKLPAAIDAARYRTIHDALLAGLLGNVGMKDAEGHEYLGARGIRFHLHPGSGLAKKAPKWVLAAELVETSRLYARCAAKVEPEWIEAVAGHRVTREYFEPRWDAERGEVVASERVLLYGLTLVPRRRVSYGRIDPVAARDVFIREALVPGALATRGAFLEHNRRLVAEVAKLEHKARRQDVLVDEAVIARFYAERLPAEIHSRVDVRALARGGRAQGSARCCSSPRETLMRHAAAHVTEELFPESIDDGRRRRLPLRYRFAPGHPLDGLTLTVPLALLNQIDAARLTWLVPGMIRDKVLLLLKALPKALRNRLTPLPDTVTAFLEASSPGKASARRMRCARGSRRASARRCRRTFGTPSRCRRISWSTSASSMRPESSSGADAISPRCARSSAKPRSCRSRRPAPAVERRGLRRWDFGDLPEIADARRRGGKRVTGYPALVDDGDSVSIALYDTREAAEASTRAGVVRLIRIALQGCRRRSWKRAAPGFTQAALQLKTTIPTDRLQADVLLAVRDRAFIGDDPLPRSEAAFADQVKRARTRLPAVAEGAFRLLASIAAEHHCA